uniref:hypothetical protein n=1 Tax=Microbulbifer agarilyticus TaxID=260552 RepID=UPI0002559A57|nr:hypothetical protein [Microbulbifer agarilyticus]
MRNQAIRRLLAAGLCSLALATTTLDQAIAQESFWGGSDHVPSLVITPGKIAIDVPMPVSGDMQLMLAMAGNGGGLAELKQKAVRSYTQHIHGEFARVLYEYLEDEEVPLVKENGLLNLENNIQIRVVKHLNSIKPGKEFDTERGLVALSGEFRFTLAGRNGNTLREQRIDIGKLKITEKYRVRSHLDGRATEDNTEEAIKDALTEMVEELVERMEDHLEADALRDLASV